MTAYREWAPLAPLAGVARLWRTVPTGPVRVLPDGCMDLLWLDGSLHVAGPDTTALIAPSTPAHGLRFRPGAAPAVLGVPAHALRDARVPLGELWPEADGLVRRLADGADPALVLAGAAVARLRADPPDLRPLLAALHTGASVRGIARELGCTERTLHRRCLDTVGYGPSVLRRILRFRAALRLARAGVPAADVAARTGYADQPHLSRDVRALAGVPLGQLLGVGVGVGVGAKRSTPVPSGSSTVA